MAVTAFAMDDDHRAAFRSGFNGYVEKPISVAAFLGGCATPRAGRSTT